MQLEGDCESSYAMEQILSVYFDCLANKYLILIHSDLSFLTSLVKNTIISKGSFDLIGSIYLHGYFLKVQSIQLQLLPTEAAGMQLLPCSLFRPVCFHLDHQKKCIFTLFCFWPIIFTHSSFRQSFSPFNYTTVFFFFFFYLSRMTSLRVVLEKQDHPLINTLTCSAYDSNY